MQTLKTQFYSLQERPLLAGVLAMFAVVAIGFALSFVTGMTSPHVVHADVGMNPDITTIVPGPDILPPCCDTTPIVTTPDILPPCCDTTPAIIVPTITAPDVLPPCCDTKPVVTTPPPDILPPCCDTKPVITTPPPDVLPPCCVTKPVVTTPPPDVLPPCCDTKPVVTTPPPVIIIPPVVHECLPGQTGTYPNCVTPPPPPVCAPGQTGTPPNCVTPPPVVHECLPGQTGTFPNCVTPPPSAGCPPGQTGTPPNCVPPPTQICPAGQTGTYPNCVTPPPPPTGGGGCVFGCSSGGGGGGGGGGFFIPPSPNVPTAAYVYLSQIPYTGLDLGPVGTVVYWAGLIIFCAALSYLVLFNLFPFLNRHIHAFGLSVAQLLNQPSGQLAFAGGAGAAAVSAHAAPMHETPAPTSNAPTSAPAMHAETMTRPNPSAYTAAQGFRSFAQGEALTMDDIVKGLSRVQESAARSTNPDVPAAQPAHVEEPHDVVTPHDVLSRSHQQNSLGRNEMARSETSHNESPAPAITTDVRDFIAALLHGDRERVFGTIRQIVREGGDAEVFLTQVVCALDDAYRARLENTKVHPEIASLTQNCATSFLERLTGALTNAIDSSYSPGVTGTKLALARALAIIEG
jgi:hypothetical protein